jgi:hypothetical protein
MFGSQPVELVPVSVNMMNGYGIEYGSPDSCDLLSGPQLGTLTHGFAIGKETPGSPPTIPPP